MGTELIDERQAALSASAEHVGFAWLLAALVVTLLMTVVAPLLSA
jgi:hypothetical protein